MKVNSKIIEKVLQVYYPNYRYLREAEINYPIGKGLFQLGKTEYMETLEHVTDIEAQLCLNQLCYVFFGHEIIRKRWEGLANLTFDEYLNLRKENVFILESHKEFKREINPREPFSGQIELTKIRKHGNLYLALLNYELAKGKSKGYLKLALINLY